MVFGHINTDETVYKTVGQFSLNSNMILSSLYVSRIIVLLIP